MILSIAGVCGWLAGLISLLFGSGDPVKFGGVTLHGLLPDTLDLMTPEEYDAVRGYLLSGAAFFEPQLEKLLERHGFLIYELLTPADIQRSMIDPAGADISAFEHVRHCPAVRKL